LGKSTPSDKVEFWSVGIDGSDLRREFLDSLGRADGARVCFAYSPNGKMVAWIRTFPEKYQEIIIHNLETGEEKTITSAKRHIDELVWVRGDKILYTTERGGFYNVWLVSADGGNPVQVTNGMENISEVKASADGQQIIYLQTRSSSDMWIVNIPEHSSHQITFHEENYYSPHLSPDGRRIAFIFGAPQDQGGEGNLNPSHLYVMNRDGSNRTQLSFGDEVVWGLGWSSNGKWISYSARKLSEPADSFRVYVVESSNPGTPRYLMHGWVSGWIDSTRLNVRLNVQESYIASLDGTPPTMVYDDSTSAFLIQGGKYIIYHDRHKGKDIGVWITEGTKPREEQHKLARLLPWNSRNIKTSGDGKTLYSIRGEEIWRMTLPDGNEERIQADFHGIDDFYNFMPNWDGKEIVLALTRSESKIVMIENLFR
jgi:hypothetical protein